MRGIGRGRRSAALTSVTISVAASVAPWVAPSPAGAVPADATYTTYTSPFVETVPVGVCGITFEVVGGAGEQASPDVEPGRGGRVIATIDVTPGATYTVRVGSTGGNGGRSGGLYTGGVGGGLNISAGNPGGFGGGYSSVEYGGSPVIIAGGGGGAYNDPDTGNDDASGGGGGANLAPPGAAYNGVAGAVGGGRVDATFHACAAAPDAPVLTAATAGNRTIDLTFTPGPDGGSPVTRWDASLDGGATWAMLATTAAGGDRTGTVTGLTNGQQYSVRVRGANTTGAGAASNTVQVSLAPVAPDAPTPVSVSPGNRSAVTVFTPPADDGGSAITGYEVSTDDGATWAPFDTAPSGGNRTGTVTPLTNGHQYTVRVRARNVVGAGTPSAGSTVTPQAGPPGPPTGLTALPRDASALVTFAAPTDDGGSAVTSYEASVDGGGTWSTLATTAGPTAGTRVGTVTGLSNGVPAQVRVRARNAAGPSNGSDAVSVTALAPPTAPDGLTAVAGVSSIAVSWAAPTTPGRAPVTTYTAYATPGPATCTTAGTDCVLGAVAGTAYTVTVVAQSGSGPSVAAGPSSPVTASAPVAPATPPEVTATLETDRGIISSVEPGERIVVIGTGFAAHSTVTVTLYSVPLPLAAVTTTDGGSFSLPVTIPSGLATGQHTLLAQGVTQAGVPRNMTLAVTVAALPTTGPPTLHVFLLGVLLVLAGGVLRRAGTGTTPDSAGGRTVPDDTTGGLIRPM